MNENNIRTLEKFLEEGKAKGQVRLSKSLTGVLIQFVKKVTDLLREASRVYIDFRKLNEIIIKNKYPILRVDDLQDRLGRVEIFIGINLKNGYYLIWIAKGEEWKIAFRIRYRLYEQ